MDHDLIGQTFDRFEILSLIGSGGMASVYRAHQTDLDRIVALKVLSSALAHDPHYVARFQQEARSIAALEHPHIVPIYAVGAIQERPYIAMKCIDGATLKDIVQERGALDLPDVMPTLEQVASAIDYAHSKGVIHRDIKPSNILIDRNNWAYLVDFGLARSAGTTQGLTLAHTIMGTPEYMSPEQAQGVATIGPATDIYSFGMVVYELLTGRIPFDSDTPMGMLVARLQYAPLPPSEYRNDISPAVEEVVMRTLARIPEARFSTASELIVALQNATGVANTSSTTQPQIAPHPSSTNQLPTVTLSSAAISEGAETIISDLDEPALLATVQPASLQSNQSTGASQVASAHCQFAVPRWSLASIGIAVLLIAITIGTTLFNNPDAQIEQSLQNAEIALAQRGGIVDAIEAYQDVLDTDPDHVVAHTQLALIHNMRGSHEQAEQAARNAIDAESNAAVAHALLAEALVNQGYDDEALETVDRAIELDPDLWTGYSARATILSERALEEHDDQLLEQAMADANMALDLAENEDHLALAMAHSSQGYVYWQQYLLRGDATILDQSKVAFEQALALQDYVAIFHVNLGYLYDAQQQHTLAREHFDEAIAIDSSYGNAYAGLGWNYYYTNDYAEALSAFDKAIVYTPQQVDAYIGKSQVYRDQAIPDYNSAIETLRIATQMAPQHERAFATLGWVYRDQALRLVYGTNEQRQGYVDAEESFRQALALQPISTDAMTGLGWVLQEQGSLLGQRHLYQEAVQILQMSLDTSDDQPYAYAALGWSNYHLGDFDKAHDAFQQATQLLPEYADAYYGLGLTLEAQGEIEQAKATYEDAVDYGSASARDELARLK